jgi:hypothetical protein
MQEKQVTIDVEMLNALMMFARLYRYELQRLQENDELRVYRGYESWLQDLQRDIELIERALDLAQQQTGVQISV